jgi:hypothetical protein
MRRVGRSYKKITNNDLRVLADIARKDREDLFHRNPDLGKIFRDRIICVALCQGAALHYLDGKTGIKDFDVWTFYRAHPQKQFNPRRNVQRDFGDPKFGKTPGATQFTGKCVNLIGRSIPWKKGQTPIKVLQDWLKHSNNESPRFLAKKAVIIIEPKDLIGFVAWPIFEK